MGDTSIIARRIEGKNYVQYGWSGNGGYYKTVGCCLLDYYYKPNYVEYLFKLGQMQHIGKPYSERGGQSILFSNIPCGEPHYLGESEREIFSRLAFVDYCYFYDLDNKWYYVIPGPFRIKIRLDYIRNHLNDDGYEFEERRRIQDRVSEYILNDYYTSDIEFQEMIKDKCSTGIDDIRKNVMNETDSCYAIWDKYKFIYDYLDDWVVIDVDDDEQNITGIKIRKNQKNSEMRIETIDW